MKYWHRRIHLVVWIIVTGLLIAAFVIFASIMNNNLLQNVNNATVNSSLFQEWEEALDRNKEEEGENEEAKEE